LALIFDFKIDLYKFGNPAPIVTTDVFGPKACAIKPELTDRHNNTKRMFFEIFINIKLFS
jgi:hypothetical protein